VHNWTAYVITPNKYFSAEILQSTVIESVIDSIDDPRGTPDKSRSKSLLDLPIESHIESLQESLLDRSDYLEKRMISVTDGETLFEWRVDLKLLQEIIIYSRRLSDEKLGEIFARGEACLSNRLLMAMAENRLGIKFSYRRASEISKSLVNVGVTEDNGKSRTYGRTVL
jgi:hypothetical protein